MHAFHLVVIVAGSEPMSRCQSTTFEIQYHSPQSDIYGAYRKLL